jgi:histidine triad (HIT) family protein
MKLSKLFFSLAKSPVGDLIVGVAFGKLSAILPVKKVKETDKVLAFWHPKPFWEKHILLVPKKAIKSLVNFKEEDYTYITEIYKVAKEIVEELNWGDAGYTILANGGTRQEVNQVHFHLCSGNEIV